MLVHSCLLLSGYVLKMYSVLYFLSHCFHIVVLMTTAFSLWKSQSSSRVLEEIQPDLYRVWRLVLF